MRDYPCQWATLWAYWPSKTPRGCGAQQATEPFGDPKFDAVMWLCPAHMKIAKRCVLALLASDDGDLRFRSDILAAIAPRISA